MHTFCLKVFLNHVLLLLVIQLTSCKIPHVKVYIWKLFNSQSSALSPNVGRSLCLNTHKPSPSSAQKPFHCVTNLSYLKLHKLANQSCVMIVVLMLIVYWKAICFANRIIYGRNFRSINFYFCLDTYGNFCFESFFEQKLWFCL